MTALGIGLTVAILVAMMALIDGLDSTFVNTGNPNDLVVIRQGSQNETNSYLDRNLFPKVRFLPEVARDQDDEPWASGELIVVINHERITGAGETSNIVVRGTGNRGFEMRPEVRIVEGRRHAKGVRELIVSRSLSRRFKNMKLGDTLAIAQTEWSVVGIFDAGGTAYDSEIWGDYDEIALAWNRPIYTSFLVRANNAQARAALAKRIEEDRNIELQAIPQDEYYEGQAISSIGIKALGIFIAVVMGIGSCFAAMNMMYGTVMARFKEIGTLRALGFRRRSILASFLAESVFLALLGGVVGCVMALPVHGITTGTTNFSSFSEVLFHFRITPEILFKAILFVSLVGIAGGLLPAARAARVRLIDVMRD
jgi:putative ABC transport system permease protein